MLDKVKSNMQAAKDVATFLKKRAVLEEEYGKQMIKLSQSMAETFGKSHNEHRTYGTTWLSFLKVHEKMGEQFIQLSTDINEASDDMQILYKDIEKYRKTLKERNVKQEKFKSDAESALEKSRLKYEQSSEEWEKSVLNRNIHESDQARKAGLFKNKTPAQLKKISDECCTKASMALSAYKSQLSLTNAARQEYFQTQLPEGIGALYCLDRETVVATRYNLARYSYFYETSTAAIGHSLDNDEGNGLRSLVQKIDIGQDSKELVSNFSRQSPGLKREDIPCTEYKMSSEAMSVLKPNPVFGVSLIELMKRDQQEIPPVMIKCVEAIEKEGLDSEGIYRLSGTTVAIQQLKNDFDYNCAEVDLGSHESCQDINVITGVLKLWLRELPDPVFPRSSYQHFMNAAKIENERMRVLGLHTIINDLPDAHYATLKYLMRHLENVRQHQDKNKMNSANLATIFGMSLMGGEENHMTIVQTVIDNYRLIFEPEE
ncbi:Rho GTPase activation protein [Sporodiniella umbellata]|nr:Rho GTPase activation protein [Sporodiniella umbellata]